MKTQIRGKVPGYLACILLALLMALAFFQHRSNIQRLRSGTENKISLKKKA